MSCVRPPNEPDFEPVTLSCRPYPPPLPPPPLLNTAPQYLATANSSPKVRLDLDDKDLLMTDEDFEEIMHDQRQLRHDCDQDEKPPSPLLPPAPVLTNRPHLRRFVTESSNLQVDNREALHTMFRPLDARSNTPLHTTRDSEPNGKSGVLYDNGMIPKVLTLTALPVSVTMDGIGVNDHAEAGGNIHYNESPTPNRAILASPAKSMPPPPRPTSSPSRDATATPLISNIRPLRRPHDHQQDQKPPTVNFSRKRKLSLSAPFSNFKKRVLDPTGAMKKLSISHLTHDATADNRATGGVMVHDNGGSGDERGRNTPMPTNIIGSHATKRSNGNDSKNHERAEGGTREGEKGGDEEGRTETPRRRRDLITPIFAGPLSSVYSPIETGPVTPTATASATHSRPQEDSRTSTPTSTIVRPQTPSTVRRITSTILRPLNHLHLHRQSSVVTHTSPSGRSPSPSPTATPTTTQSTTIPNVESPFASTIPSSSKSSLNKLIISLRTQITDLTLENRVLRDQIAIVRRDWIETSQELDLERHRCWEREMERFRMGVRVEELRGEIRALKEVSRGEDIRGGGE